MPRWYEELGATPADSQAELQRRYRQRALELHPDIHDDPGAEEAMRRLNQAWAVLGDPRARGRYDDQLRTDRQDPDGGTAAPGPDPATETDGVGVRVPRPLRLFRPSVIIPLVLFVIFVGTAYAGRVGTGSTAPSPSTTTAIFPDSARLAGQCVRRQAQALSVVACSQSNDGQVAAVVALSGRCPAGASGAPIPGQAAIACLKPARP